MSFIPLQSGDHRSAGAKFGFTIRSRGEGRQCVCFTICPRLIKRLGWRDGVRLRLDIDAKAHRGRLAAVGGDDEDGRKLRINPKSGRGEWFFPFSGEALDYFEAYESVYDLDDVQISAPGEITFDLPPEPQWEDGDGEEEAESSTA